MQKTQLVSTVVRHRDLLSWIGCWSAGLLTGTYLAVSTDPSFYLGMRAVISAPVSFPGLLAVTFVPFLLSAWMAAVSLRKLLLILIFFRTCTFSFLGTALSLCYGSAGWLVRCLFQFSGVVTLPVFCWFCLRCYNGCAAGSRIRDLCFCFLYTAIAVVADHFAVAPLLAQAVIH